ncbi:MAG: recombinase family protein [Acidobacteria bacterium]|nr:recombinase family protein [Acidobacteriota bacterium]
MALYARVSTEAQEARGTIGSQLEVLRTRVRAEGDELVAEFIDDGYSGARLDRPGLDALRDAAEARLIDGVWCLSPDRLARVYAYQVIVCDELARHGVAVLFSDAPPIGDDPQARLLTQVQGVIAEYERAKMAERYRRGKLWRSKEGEVISWKAPYGYRRVLRSAGKPAHLDVYEPEAVVVREIFSDYVTGGHSIREITRRLNAREVPSPTGNPVWGTSTVSRLLRNDAYVGCVYYNRTQVASPTRPAKHPTTPRPRSREEWIAIPVPPIVASEVFEAAAGVSRDNSKWSPRNAEPGVWLLRGLVRCGACGVGVNCHRMRGRNGTTHRYYYCRNHDPLRAGGEDRRCPERNVRADALDAFVFDQVREALLRPETLIAGEAAIGARAPATDDELLATQLERLDRKRDATEAERRRLTDLYQSGLVELSEIKRRVHEIDARRRQLDQQRSALAERHRALAQHNRLRRRVGEFATRIARTIDRLDFDERQQLLRLLVEEVRVAGHRVEIRLRIPFDDPENEPPTPDHSRRRQGPRKPSDGASREDRLRSFGDHLRCGVERAVHQGWVSLTQEESLAGRGGSRRIPPGPGSPPAPCRGAASGPKRGPPRLREPEDLPRLPSLSAAHPLARRVGRSRAHSLRHLPCSAQDAGGSRDRCHPGGRGDLGGLQPEVALRLSWGAVDAPVVRRRSELNRFRGSHHDGPPTADVGGRARRVVGAGGAVHQLSWAAAHPDE